MQKEYGALKEALTMRFGRMEHPTIARRQLSFLRQKEGESLEDYIDRVLKSVKHTQDLMSAVESHVIYTATEHHMSIIYEYFTISI